MHKFTNPLDKIKIASPCGADWNEMRGDNRRRYCTMCKLNVYNLSGMTQTEAESFLINSEGRVGLPPHGRHGYYQRLPGRLSDFQERNFAPCESLCFDLRRNFRRRFCF